MLIWIEREDAQKNAPATGCAVGANAADEAASLGNSPNALRALPVAGVPISEPPCGEWMSDFRALVGIYEKERWQGLNDGTESRNFVPTRMRLAKHYFNAYDSACRAGHAAAIAIMKKRLERLAFDPRSRWGALL